MKKILDVLVDKKNYQIIFEDDLIVLSPEIYRKFHLKKDMMIDLKTIHEIKDAQNYLKFYTLGIKKLKKMMTILEMEMYLLSLDAKPKIIKQILFEFTKKGYLNDSYYAETYIKNKSDTEGPHLIIDKLQQKGISSGLIYEYLSQINEKEIIEKLAIKKIKSIKKKSKKQTLFSVKQFLLNKGFHREQIDLVLYENQDIIVPDQLSDIDPLFNQLHRRLKQKYQGNELKYQLKQKLYQKGFGIDLIDQYLSKKSL
jgi:regulatory protein